MKAGKKSLKMGSGEIRHFGSEEKRDNFEKVASAYSHGWKGPRKSNGGAVMDTDKLFKEHVMKCFQGGKIKTYAEGGPVDPEKRKVQLRAKVEQGSITDDEYRELLRLQSETSDAHAPIEQPETPMMRIKRDSVSELSKYASGGLTDKIVTTPNDEEPVGVVPAVNPNDISPNTASTPVDLDMEFRKQLLSEFSPAKEIEAGNTLKNAQNSPLSVIGQGLAGFGDAYLASVGQKGGGLEGILTRAGKEREDLGQRFSQGRQGAIALTAAERTASAAKNQFDASQLAQAEIRVAQSKVAQQLDSYQEIATTLMGIDKNNPKLDRLQRYQLLKTLYPAVPDSEFANKNTLALLGVQNDKDIVNKFFRNYSNAQAQYDKLRKDAGLTTEIKTAVPTPQSSNPEKEERKPVRTGVSKFNPQTGRVE